MAFKRSSIPQLVIFIIFVSTTVCAHIPDVSLGSPVQQNTTSVLPVIRQALPSDPPYPHPRIPSLPSCSDDVESVVFKNGRYVVSCDKINLPDTINNTINKAIAERKPLDIIANHIKFASVVSMPGVTKLRIIAHNCTFVHPSIIHVAAPLQTAPRPPVGSVGRTPPQSPSGIDAGDVEVRCTNLLLSERTDIYIASAGGDGVDGAKGGNGADGLAGTDGKPGSCIRTRESFPYNCLRLRGQPGIPRTAGRPGARGGAGGDGGNGGNVIFHYVRKSDHEVNILPRNRGGEGGKPGPGGHPGSTSPYIRPIRYVVGCSVVCSRRTRLENRPPVTIIISAAPSGERGRDGARGNFTVTTLG